MRDGVVCFSVRCRSSKHGEAWGTAWGRTGIKGVSANDSEAERVEDGREEGRLGEGRLGEGSFSPSTDGCVGRPRIQSTAG
jgi:hypothetical protein